MGKRNQKAFVVYSSPAGTTRHVAQVIINTLNDLGCEPRAYNLGDRTNRSKLNSEVKDLMNDCCLWIGSPVYFGYSVPPIIEFIEQLPVNEGGFAVPFVTFGGVTSGIALYEMGKMLNEKGYAIIGSAKILAIHSGMLQCENPLGEGHPDSDDDSMIINLVRKVNSKLLSKPVQTLTLENLNYQQKDLRETMQKRSFKEVKQKAPPRQLDKEACTQCGICEENCPTQAIKSDPYPQFGDECILCYNCVRLCQEKAIKTSIDLSQAASMWRKMAEKYAERPLSQIFF